MAKKGPCSHCGIVSAPHWRQGPEEKPVLCNACGIRFKHWGNLHNYTPKHCVPNNLNNHKLVKDNGNTSSNVPDEDSDNGGKNSWIYRSPSKRRSQKGYKKMTPIQKFQKQLFDEWRYHAKPKEEDVLLFQNMNNFIPSNEIGLGAILLKPAKDGSSASR